MNAKKKCCCCLSNCFCAIFALGILFAAVLGWFFWKDFECALSAVVALFAAGFAASYLLLSILSAIGHEFSLHSSPVPGDLDFSDREALAAKADAIKGRSPLASNLRTLLRAAAAGAPGPQIARMAATQMNRAILSRIAEAAAVIAALTLSSNLGGSNNFLAIGSILLVLVPVVAFFRVQLAARSAGYLESALLADIPDTTTPAAASADFAAKAAKSVQASTDALADAQSKAASALADAQTKSAASIAEAQTKAAASLAEAQSKIAASLSETQTKVAEQLARVSDIAASVDKVLQLQHALDKSLAGLSASEEFKSTFADIRKHLDDSNALIRSVSKPRTIRFVENPAE